MEAHSFENLTLTDQFTEPMKVPRTIQQQLQATMPWLILVHIFYCIMRLMIRWGFMLNRTLVTHAKKELFIEATWETAIKLQIWNVRLRVVHIYVIIDVICNKCTQLYAL